MSDLETLIVTFQTQLSDVMEVVVKTAMFEVTRLVEDVFLEEVKRSKQEVQSLRLQVQVTEGKFSCVNCARMDSDQSSDPVEGRPRDPHDDISGSCDVKNPCDPVEFWMPSSSQDGKIASPDHSGATRSSERESHVPEEDDLMTELDMKEEEVNKLSCSSVHLRRWSSTLDGEGGCDSGNLSELVETQAVSTPENSEEVLKTVIKKDPQISVAFPFPEDQEDTHMSSDRSNVSAFELDSSWAGLPTAAGLLQAHRLASEKECDPVKSKGSMKLAEHDCSDSVRTDVQFTSDRDQVSSSEPQRSRLQPSNMLSVTVKEEAIDSGGCKEIALAGTKPKEAETPSFSCSVQHKVSSEAHKTNRMCHKSTMQEAMKLHSNKNTGLKLHAAIQHLHRPLKKPPHALSSSPTAALSTAHSQVVNINNLNRNSSTCKTVAPPTPSVQRFHLGDKQTLTLNRTGASWVSVKSHQQPGNSHNANSSLQPGSHPNPGARHLLRCGQCGKCFPHPSNLKAHVQTHTGERPFCCSLCSRSFTKLSNLKAHRRVHTGERPYCCLACGKRFTQKCNLKRHQRIHLDM